MNNPRTDRKVGSSNLSERTGAAQYDVVLLLHQTARQVSATWKDVVLAGGVYCQSDLVLLGRNDYKFSSQRVYVGGFMESLDADEIRR